MAFAFEKLKVNRMIRGYTDYALRSLVHIAMSPNKAATARELGEAQDVPVGFAQEILRKLARAGILEATQPLNAAARTCNEARVDAFRGAE